MKQALERPELFIGGRWTTPSTADRIQVVSPYTREVVGFSAKAGPADIDAAVAAARTAFDDGPWPRMSVAERAAFIGAMAEHLKGRAGDIPAIVAQEMGSPVSWGAANHAGVPVAIMAFMSKVALAYEHTTTRTGMMGGQLIVHQVPVGVVAGIGAWNVPMFMAAAKITTALLAGCTVVYKPASLTPLDCLLFADAAVAAGLPEGVLSIVPCDAATADRLVASPDVDKVTFTGSGSVGGHVARTAAPNITRVTLELGGKSAAIVLPDADLDAVVPNILRFSMPNMGQVCVSQTRVLLPRERYDEFAARYVAGVESMVIGDPLDPATQVGPMSSMRQAESVREYIRLGIAEGAELLTGGPEAPEGQHEGFIRPTVFGNVKNSMRIAQEEIFGPVVCLIAYDDVDEAVAIANESDLGLSGSVWGSDTAAAIEVGKRVRTGHMNINTFTLDLFGPFGGFKHSGNGREFGPEGYSSFLETQTINIPADYMP